MKRGGSSLEHSQGSSYSDNSLDPIKMLNDEYGIQISQGELSEDELIQKGYRKVSLEEASRLSSALQYVPQLAANKFMQDEARTQFDSVVRNSFLIKIRPGLHLGRSHTTPGAFKGNAYDSANKLKGQADLIRNNATLTISQVPQIAANIMNAASYVCGQYFMSQVDGKLKSIHNDTQAIITFLRNAQISQIEAVEDELEDIIRHMKFIDENDARKSSFIEQLHTIQRTARHGINLSIRDINSTMTTATVDDKKEEEISQKVQSVFESLAQYYLSVNVFCTAKIIEVYLSNIEDDEEIATFQRELNKLIDEFDRCRAECIKWSNRYLNTIRSLNERNAYQNAGTLLSAILAIKNVGFISSARMINEDIDAKRQKKKQRITSMADALVNRIESSDTLRKPVNDMLNCVRLTKRETEIVQINDAFYTNVTVGICQAQ